MLSFSSDVTEGWECGAGPNHNFPKAPGPTVRPLLSYILLCLTIFFDVTKRNVNFHLRYIHFVHILKSFWEK